MTNCRIRRARGRPTGLFAALLIGALPASGLAAATGTASIGNPALASPGAVPVTFTVTLSLAALHPAVTKGALECGAVAQTQAWIDAHRDLLVDYDSTTRWVLSPGHYYGAKAILEFPVVAGAYAGALTFTTTLTGAALLDSTTRAAYAPNPSVLVACWLQLNGRPAAWDQGPGLQVVSSTNYASVNQKPLVFASLAGTAGAPAGAAGTAATGQLSARGSYFSPAPVAIVQNLQIGGPRASRAPKAATLSQGTPAAPAVPSITGGNSLAPGSTPVNANANGTAAARAITPVPAVTGLGASSTNPVAHTVQWSCAASETLCGATNPGTPTFSYEVWIQYPGDKMFTQLKPASGPADSQNCNEYVGCSPGTTITVGVSGFLAPGSTFRVFRKDPAGAHTALYTDFVFASPAQPQEPAGFTATEPQFGQVAFTWQLVPAAVAYRLFEKGSTAPPARIMAVSPPANTQQCDPYYGCGSQPPATQSTTFSHVTAGNHTYQIATEYSAGYRSTNLPEASVLAHAGLPAHSGAFLTKNNGAGSAAAAALHLGANQGIDLMTLAGNYGVITGWDSSNNPIFQPQSATAAYANVTELGVGRDTTCWQWPEMLGAVQIGKNTFCLSGNHGAPPVGTAPNGSALATDALAGAGQSISLIFMSPTKGQLFASLKPRNASGPWGFNWAVSPSAVFDSEGTKYVPHACLSCHGGTVNAANGRVSGASLLPIDPGLVVFPAGNSNRAAQEEQVRMLNAMVAASNPSPAIADYINGLYNGKATTPGAVAQTSYIPAGWSQQAQLFQMVVKPDCLMCHLATPQAQNFGSAANFIQDKAAIYADVCQSHSMPHAEVPYQTFWTSTSPLGTTTVTLSGFMLGILGYTTCP